MRASRILIYSTAQFDLTGLESIFDNTADLDIIVARDFDDFSHQLNERTCDFIIIDYDGRMPESRLTSAVNIASRKNITAIITNLRKNNSGDDEIPSSAEFNFNRKLTLHKGGEEASINPQEKIELVNQTAATLSHEINTPLMVIAANVEVLLKNNEIIKPDIMGKIKTIGSAAERIRTVTDKLSDIKSLHFRETAAGRMLVIDEPNPETDPAQDLKAETALK